MYTLQIEHEITGFAQWTGAFERFATRRAQAGVLAERVCRPVDRPDFVVVELDFETEPAAVTFLAFLRDSVWIDPRTAPALASTPSTRILQREARTP